MQQLLFHFATITHFIFIFFLKEKAIFFILTINPVSRVTMILLVSTEEIGH